MSILGVLFLSVLFLVPHRNPLLCFGGKPLIAWAFSEKHDSLRLPPSGACQDVQFTCATIFLSNTNKITPELPSESDFKFFLK